MPALEKRIKLCKTPQVIIPIKTTVALLPDCHSCSRKLQYPLLSSSLSSLLKRIYSRCFLPVILAQRNFSTRCFLLPVRLAQRNFSTRCFLLPVRLVQRNYRIVVSATARSDMGRRKVETGLIECKKTRFRTFANRKNGILKKANELSKLCDVDVGVVIYGPNSEEKPLVWPEEPLKLAHILRKYQTTSEADRRKRATNLPSISSTKKIDAQKIDLDGLSADQLIQIIDGLDLKLEIVKEKIDLIKNYQNPIKFDGISEEQGMGMMGMGVQVQPSSFQWEQHHQYDEEQRLRVMMMMMMNGGNCLNPTNDNVGECSGLIGMGNYQNDCFEERMWNANPITLLQQQQQQQQQQAQQGQLPFYSINDFNDFYPSN